MHESFSERGSEQQSVVSGQQSRTARNDLQPLRVIIAEDSILIREGLARLIADSGGVVLAKVGDGPSFVEAVVEHNRCAQPHLLPGKNVVTASVVKDALPKDCVVTVTYAYQEATAPAAPPASPRASTTRSPA